MRTPVSRIEMIAGIFLLLGLIALGALLVFPGVISGRFLSSHQLTVRATEGLGLAIGDKVMMQGIQIGEVTDLGLDEFNQIRIICNIQPRHAGKIRSGSRVLVSPGALFSSAQVRVSPGEGGPLLPGTVFQAEVDKSVFDRLGKLADNVGETLDGVKQRVSQLEGSLAAVEKLLDGINSGKGSLGKLVYEDEFHQRLVDLITQLERSLKTADEFLARLDDFAEVLPEVKVDFKETMAKVRSATVRLDKGMEHFPDAASRTIDALAEGRRVIESLKRNFLIRSNLPRDPEATGTAPSSLRATLPTP